MDAKIRKLISDLEPEAHRAYENAPSALGAAVAELASAAREVCCASSLEAADAPDAIDALEAAAEHAIQAAKIALDCAALLRRFDDER